MGIYHDQIAAEVAAREGLVAAAGVGRIHLIPARDRARIKQRTLNIRAIRNQAAASLKLDVLPWDSKRKRNCTIVNKFGQDFLVEAIQKNGGSFLDPRGLHQIYLQATDLGTGKVHRWNGARKERFQCAAMPTSVRTDRVVGVQVDPATGEEQPIYEIVEDPAAAALAHFRHAALLGITEEPAGDATKEYGNTTTIVYPDAGDNTGGTVDGRVYRGAVDETIATILAGAGDAAEPTQAARYFGVWSSGTADQVEYMIEALFTFDLTAVGSDTVSAATFTPTASGNAQVTLGTQDFHVVSASLGANDTLVASDYRRVGSESFGTTDNATLTGAGVSDDIALNGAGKTHCEGGGIVGLGLICDVEFDASWVLSWAANKQSNMQIYFADEAGTSNDPKLTIEHEAAAAAASGMAPHLAGGMIPGLRL